MLEWLLFLIAVAVVTISGIVIVLRRRQRAYVDRLDEALSTRAAETPAFTVDFSTLGELPAPVQRYFRHVLADGQPSIREAVLDQTGVLRTGVRTENWTRFTATHRVLPSVHAFLWDARVELPVANHIRVLDSYIDGTGAGRVSLMSAFVLGEEVGGVGLDLGSLYRYLAEGVWCPTALLPQSGVQWSAIDDRRALATLTHEKSTATLEFRFDENDEVVSVYTSDRPGNLDGRFQNAPWEGHFRRYETRDGMRVPTYGEVGWYQGEQLELVWEGDIRHFAFRFTAEASAR